MAKKKEVSSDSSDSDSDSESEDEVVTLLQNFKSLQT